MDCLPELQFRTLELTDYDMIYGYMSKYGEGSCQHSFVSMYTLQEKYGDMIAERDGFLFTLRSHLCDGNYRVYLAPMGGRDLKAAYETILADAARYGKKVKFFTLTDIHADFLRSEFPECFEITEDRGLAEYMYRCEKFAAYPGRALYKRRAEVNHFWKTYGERATATVITKDDFPALLAFEEKWLEQSCEDHDMASLEREARSIRLQLRDYDALHLSGIVLRIDGEVRAYGYGTQLSDVYYDSIIEKADRDVPFCYRVVRQEAIKQCAMNCMYDNMEEDLGIEGLRQLKLLYHPDMLLNKSVAIQK